MGLAAVHGTGLIALAGLLSNLALALLLALILLERILKVDILPVGRAVGWVVRLLLRLVDLA